MRENLLGFLLGALDANEHNQVERELARSPQLRRDLECLRRRLQPLALEDDHVPPASLSSRTCAFVAAHADQASHADQHAPPVGSGAVQRSDRARAAAASYGAPGPSWSLGDVVVAAGIFIGAAMLFFPAIAHSRYLAQLASCQNNLRQLGVQLDLYSERAGQGYYPFVPSEGPRAFAGVYATTLKDNGLLNNPAVLLCPASSWAQRPESFYVPAESELEQARDALTRLQRMAGGSYGYNLGVVVDGQHRAARNLGRTHFALMCDSPTRLSGGGDTRNHAGRGLNLLFGDGRVTFVRGCTADQCRDDPLLNHWGRLEPGVGPDDAVLAPSGTPPFGIQPVLLRQH